MKSCATMLNCVYNITSWDDKLAYKQSIHSKMSRFIKYFFSTGHQQQLQLNHAVHLVRPRPRRFGLTNRLFRKVSFKVFNLEASGLLTSRPSDLLTWLLL